MEGESYITANPFTFNDESFWNFKDLQQLCKKFRVKANGSREELVTRLIDFHRARDSQGKTVVDSDEENIPMNVNGNNFAILQMNVVPQSAEKKKRLARPVDIKKSEVIKACPSTLRPLQGADLQSLTPSKSILKRGVSPDSVQKSACVHSPVPAGTSSSSAAYNMAAMSATKAMAAAMCPGGTPGKLEKITFSPFNAVKVIPHRSAAATVSAAKAAAISALNCGGSVSGMDGIYGVVEEEEGEVAEESEEDDENDAAFNPSKKITFTAMDMEDGDEDDEDEGEYGEWGDEDDEDEDDEDIYSDDEETSYLVFANTQRNSSLLTQQQQMPAANEQEEDDEDEDGEEDEDEEQMVDRAGAGGAMDEEEYCDAEPCENSSAGSGAPGAANANTSSLSIHLSRNHGWAPSGSIDASKGRSSSDDGNHINSHFFFEL